MLADLLTRPITIVRSSESGSVDAYGNDIPVSRLVETVGELQQRTRSEGEQTVGIGEWLLIVPPGTVIDTNDQVIVDGSVYELAGPGWPVRRPGDSVDHHGEYTLRRVSGEDFGS